MNAMPCEESTASLFAVWDVTTNRDLLTDAEPKHVALNGESTQFGLRIVNGSRLTLILTVAADQSWLRPANNRIELPAGGSADLDIHVFREGRGEYGILQFVWQESNLSLVEPILILRQHTSPSASPAVSHQPALDPSPQPPVPVKSSWLDDWVDS